jgi:ABC-2 type transport system ATP-binding protein
MALSGRGIRKTFVRDNSEVVLALDDVSLQVHSGTLAALVGPDGAGKTTLIRLAAGLLPFDEGELQVLGISVSTDAQQVQDRLYAAEVWLVRRSERPGKSRSLR